MIFLMLTLNCPVVTECNQSLWINHHGSNLNASIKVTQKHTQHTSALQVSTLLKFQLIAFIFLTYGLQTSILFVHTLICIMNLNVR